MRGNALIHIHHKDHFVFQALGIVHGGESNSIIIHAPACLDLLFQFFPVIFNIGKPLFRCVITFGTLLDLIKDFCQIIGAHPPESCVLGKIFLITNAVSDVLDGRIGLHLLQ